MELLSALDRRNSFFVGRAAERKRPGTSGRVEEVSERSEQPVFNRRGGKNAEDETRGRLERGRGRRKDRRGKEIDHRDVEFETRGAHGRLLRLWIGLNERRRS